MFRIRKTKKIECAHHLPNHDGKCARIHGHSYSVTFELESKDILKLGSGPKEGMVADYSELGEIMKTYVECFDHTDLNSTFQVPTAEWLAAYFHAVCTPVVKSRFGERVWLSAVQVSETEGTVAEYRL